MNTAAIDICTDFRPILLTKGEIAMLSDESVDRLLEYNDGWRKLCD